ncbi:MAG: bifunctional hydroxymethylpyrimidine kinase/phosphomethylpyrimidine kinase [Betaproteobacteria bacterium]
MSCALPVVLTFAASDPTGGAGLQADVLTIGALGCHPLSVLTGFTVQDTHGVSRLRALDAAAVEEQARRLLDDIAVDAFKVGVLASAENARAVAGIVAQRPQVPLVLDPVLASGRGEELAGAAVIEALARALVPHATVVTPNSVEAKRLGGPQRLLALGCKFVLVTGTHEAGAEVVNVLYDARGVVREDRWRRLPGEYHGSGCTLASAIAASLASGRAPAEAVREGQAYTWETLAAAFRPGAGQSIPRRFLRH